VNIMIGHKEGRSERSTITSRVLLRTILPGGPRGRVNKIGWGGDVMRRTDKLAS